MIGRCLTCQPSQKLSKILLVQQALGVSELAHELVGFVYIVRPVLSTGRALPKPL